MPDVEKILRMVADGALTAEEADEILSALGGESGRPTGDTHADDDAAAGGTPRRLRIEVREGGRRVVNLSVPLNIAGLAGAFVPGLSDEDSDRIQSAIRSGQRGPIVDVGSEDGDRVLIVSE